MHDVTVYKKHDNFQLNILKSQLGKILIISLRSLMFQGWYDLKLSLLPIMFLIKVVKIRVSYFRTEHLEKSHKNKFRKKQYSLF